MRVWVVLKYVEDNPHLWELRGKEMPPETTLDSVWSTESAANARAEAVRKDLDENVHNDHDRWVDVGWHEVDRDPNERES